MQVGKPNGKDEIFRAVNSFSIPNINGLFTE